MFNSPKIFWPAFDQFWSYGKRGHLLYSWKSINIEIKVIFAGFGWNLTKLGSNNLNPEKNCPIILKQVTFIADFRPTWNGK